MNTYLNGPRTLSNDRLAYIVIATPGETPNFPFSTPNNEFARSLANVTLLPPMPSLQQFPTASGPALQDFHYLLATPHCLGDGMALYRMSDEFFQLVASDHTDEGLEHLVFQEWERAVASAKVSHLPQSCHVL